MKTRLNCLALVALGLLFSVLTCFAAGGLTVERIIPQPGGPRTLPPLDSAQPDTLVNDDGTVAMFYTAPNLWARVRFTAAEDMEVRSIYFVANNPIASAVPCSAFVYTNNDGNLGARMSGSRIPGTVVHFGDDLANPVWNDFDLPAPLAVAAGQDFFVILGPQPGGSQSEGWHILLDAAESEARSSIRVGSLVGAYNTAAADFMVRAGVAPLSATGRGFVTLLTAGPPQWTYELHRNSGIVNRVVFSDVCLGTIGHALDAAGQAGWTATSDSNSIVFASPNAVWGSSLTTFVLTNPGCSGNIHWLVGDSTGSVDGPLPVELLAFSAAPADNAVDLHFVTATESSNAYFEIYRGQSPDGPFSKLTQIASHGASATQQEYRYLDDAVTAGHTYWYYLADVDLAGNRTEHSDWLRSAAAGMPSLITDYSLAAYPNPFNPTTTIEFALPEAGSVRLAIYDVNGRQVQSLADAPCTFAGRHTLTFDAGHLPSGNLPRPPVRWRPPVLPQTPAGQIAPAPVTQRSLGSTLPGAARFC